MLWYSMTFCLAALATLYISGGLLFHLVERDAELQQYRENRALFDSMKELWSWERCNEAFYHDMEFCANQEIFEFEMREFFRQQGNSFIDQEKFTISGSIFFVHDLLTTVGYGNRTPLTNAGKILAMIYGLLGIPVMSCVVIVIGTWMKKATENSLHLCCATPHHGNFVLAALLLTIILAGGVLFSSLEHWNFVTGLYFSFCSATTVGFGDYYPTHYMSRLLCLVFTLATLGVATNFVAMSGHTLNKSVTQIGEKLSNLNSYGAITEEVEAKPTTSNPFAV